MNRPFRFISQSAIALSALFLAVFLSGAVFQNTKPETDSDEPSQALAEALRQHSYPISLREGKLNGAGLDFLARKSTPAEFVLFGEQHYVKEFPEFLSARFVFLHEKQNFMTSATSAWRIPRALT